MKYEAQQKLKAKAAKQREQMRQKVLTYIAENPGLSQREVGDHFGKTGAWVSRLLKKV